ncbi:hypothetical protein HPP92_006742 [Vanilla planifolia]|uniref:Uncharacterized protein n=1 Tax=Vanilla planifolia TaxID=51239 RepID=A0A835V9E3_VANPL|nr:hypothetical protein HPP92_006742 [Vanilla planifolia]
MTTQPSSPPNRAIVDSYAMLWRNKDCENMKEGDRERRGHTSSPWGDLTDKKRPETMVPTTAKTLFLPRAL